jgi:hypothetical protein
VHTEQYIRKIVDEGDQREMEKLSDILSEVIDLIKDYDEETYKKYNTDIYEMAYGKRLTDEMKKEWVNNMRPAGRWSLRQVEDIFSEYDSDIPILSMYVIMNILSSDMGNLFDFEDDRQNIEKYIQASRDWYYDEDAAHTQEEKLYYYWKYIAN